MPVSWRNLRRLIDDYVKKAGEQGMKAEGKSLFEKLLYLGIITFFFWPFVQLWSIDAVPLMDSNVHQKAAVAVANLLEEARSRPFTLTPPETDFVPIMGYENEGLSGRVTFSPHPRQPGLWVLDAQVRWGMFPFRKTLELESIVARTRP